MRRTLIVAIVVVVAAGVFVIARRDNGPDTSSPEGALRSQLEMIRLGQYGRAYDEIHPAQQGLFTRDAYVRCLETTRPRFSSVKVLDSYVERSKVAGTALDVESTAVTVELNGTGLLASGSSAETFHEFSVDGGWRFSVSDPGSIAKGLCE